MLWVPLIYNQLVRSKGNNNLDLLTAFLGLCVGLSP